MKPVIRDLDVMVHLVLVVVTPSTTLLAVAAVLVATEAALAVATILAALVSLGGGVLATETTESAVLATSLAAVKVVLLLEVAWITAVALLSRLWWWKGGLAWSVVGGRSWAGGLSKGWAWTISGLRITEWLQIVRGTLLAALSVLLRLALVRGAAAESVHGVVASSSADWLSSGMGLLRSSASILSKSSTNGAVTTVKGRTTESTGSWRWGVVVWSLWRHSVGLWLVVHGALSVWSGTVVTLAVTLERVSVHGAVVWAVVVWVGVWVVSRAWLLTLWLSSVWLLCLSSRLSRSLLSLGRWVWSRVAAGLGLAGGGVSGLSSLGGGLWEWGGGGLGSWGIVAAERTLGRWGVLLGLLAVLAAVVVVITLLVSSIILGVPLAWSRGEGTSLRLGAVALLAWVSIVLAWSGWGLLAECIVWLLAESRVLLSCALSVATVLVVLVASLRSLLGHGLSSWQWRWKSWRGDWGGWETLWLLLRLWETLGSGCWGWWQGSSWVGNWGVLWLSTSLGLLAVSIDILLGVFSKVESSKLNCGTVNLTVAWHANGLLLVKNTALEAGSARGSSGSLLGGSCETTGGWCWAGGLCLERREWSCVGASWIPRAGSCAGSGSGCSWWRNIQNLLDVRLGKLVLRWLDNLWNWSWRLGDRWLLNLLLNL